ncbi:MAG: hypothetical protein R6V10_15945 [bacterium]
MSDNDERRHEEESCEDLKEEQKMEQAGEKGDLCRDDSEEDDVLAGAEPWDPIETKIVVGSFIAAVVFLAIFGFLINHFIL